MNINKANIANAIHSVARDHVVAVADDIYDESRDQYQSILNEGVGLYEENPEFVKAVTDKNGKFLYGVRLNGEFVFGAGVPSQIQEKLDEVYDTFGNIEENPEFIRLYLDNEGKILWGIQKDGNVVYGAGVPQQVVDYINKRIAELSLDEYEDIVAFLSNLEKGDKTLQALLNEKVDKEEGKSLIDSEYASTKSITESPEFLDVIIDAEDKVLEGIQKDGTKVIGGDLNVCGSTNISGDATVRGNVELTSESIQSVDNPEYLKVTTDVQGKILDGIKKDGSHYIHNVQSESIDALNTRVDNINTHVGEVDDKLHTLRKVSILGDSISTFDQDGFKVDGFGMWYPKEEDRSSDVKSVEDTWWKQVLNNQGAIIEVNASSSGSTATNLSIGFSPRVPLLGNPDVIYIALGTNDSANNVPIGEFNYNAESYDLSQFAPAYIKGMKDTVARYPKAKIICVAFDMGIDYQNAIQQIASHYGAAYIYVGDISDVHPNKAEMHAVANVISGIFTALENNPEYIEAKTDSENKILEGITTDGIKKINIPVDNGAAIIEATDIPEYLEVKVDAKGKLIEGINKNGEKIFGVIPPQIKQYIDENMPVGGSGVQSIEYDEETGDMYATYDDESGVTDVSMDPNGDIYVEYETGV